MGTTHEDTIEVGYCLAVFYAEQGRMPEADATLEKITTACINKWEISHDTTQKHIRKVVGLLNVWGRKTESFALLDRAHELEEDGLRDPDESPTTITAISRPLDGDQVTDRLRKTRDMVEYADPAAVDYALRIARQYALAVDDSVVQLLQAIIERCECDEHKVDELAVQRIQAYTELLGFHQQAGDIDQHENLYDHAEVAFEDVIAQYAWDSKSAKSLKLYESCMELAAAFVKSNYTETSLNMFSKHHREGGRALRHGRAYGLEFHLHRSDLSTASWLE